MIIFKKYKTFFRIDIQLYQHEWKLEKQEIVWKHDARRADITVYQQGKIFYNFFII